MANVICPQRIIKEAIRLLDRRLFDLPCDETEGEEIENTIKELEDMAKVLPNMLALEGEM